MKTHQLTLATLLLTLFLINNLKSQTIDSLKIIPINPTSNDTIKVICYTTFPYGDCNLGSSSVNIVDSIITIYTSYNIGLYPAFCNSIDTLTIGILNAGTYELTCHLSDTAPPTTYDIDTIIFTVQQGSGLQLIDNSGQEIKAYPNPTTTEIYINLKTQLNERHDIDIYSVFGQKIKTIKTDKKKILINISDLTEGVYFIVIISDYDKQWTQKIIKNAP